MTQQTKKIIGITEQRFISKIPVTSQKLHNMLCSKGRRAPELPKCKISFNLMLITSDEKILILERTQSFHYLKFRKSKDEKLLPSLYPEEVRSLGITPNSCPLKNIYIFPGGHSKVNETVLLTLLREFQEETSININANELKFNQTCFFNVNIYDFLIQKNFINLIFPTRINMSSCELAKKFKTTRHTRNPRFINMSSKNVFLNFLLIQSLMIR